MKRYIYLYTVGMYRSEVFAQCPRGDEQGGINAETSISFSMYVDMQ